MIYHQLKAVMGTGRHYQIGHRFSNLLGTPFLSNISTVSLMLLKTAVNMWKYFLGSVVNAGSRALTDIRQGHR